MDKYLEKAILMYPNASCELNYNTPFEFLIAVVLSAQTTDKKVNGVTSVLFDKYKNAYDLSNASFDDVYRILKPLGLAKGKTLNIINLSKEIVFLGYIPETIGDLIKLTGVGNKTACVYMQEIYKEPHIAVDTHVSRVALRLGLTKEKNPLKIQKDLENRYLKEEYIKAHHTFLFLGRYCCKSIKPNCNECLLRDICDYYKKESSKI